MNIARSFQLLIPNLRLGGRYQVVRRLGAGGFSETFLAKDTQLPGQPYCVIKQLKPRSRNLDSWQVAKRLFDAEATVLYRLGDHDRIPRLFAHFEDNQNFYLVQEFIAGASLRQKLIPNQPWSEARVIALIRDILQVLAYVHAQNVIHRDIKPSNLICRKMDGRIVLIDFGAVKQVSLRTEVDNEAHTDQSVTISIGTHGYMPMEQANGMPRFNSDIYAVGMIGIEALTGMRSSQFQRDGQTGELIWRSVQSDRASTQPIQVSDELGEILDGMVRCHFKERYQTVQDVLQAIDALLSQRGEINLEVELAALALDSTVALSELPDTSSDESDETSSEQLPLPSSLPLAESVIGLTAPLTSEPTDLASNSVSDPASDPATVSDSATDRDSQTQIVPFSTLVTQKLVGLQERTRTIVQRLSTVPSADVLKQPRWRPLSRQMWVGVGGLMIAAGVVLAGVVQNRFQAPVSKSLLLNLSCQEPSPSPLPSRSPDLIYPDGTRYYGSLSDGLPADGRGVMVFPSGNRYDGEFKAGKRNGCGTYTFANGRRYVGQFQDDSFQGQGLWLLETGDRYVGEFQANRCHGEGTFIFSNGETKRGIWRNGQLEGTDLSCDR